MIVVGILGENKVLLGVGLENPELAKAFELWIKICVGLRETSNTI